MIKINKGEQDTPLKHKGADKMKDFLFTQVMTPQQVKYAVDNSHAVIGHTTKEGEHVTVVRQWRLKADGLFTNDIPRATGGRMMHTVEIGLIHPQTDGDAYHSVLPKGSLTDGTISRLHFVLEWLPVDDVVTIADFPSTNGTFVNGERIKHQWATELKDGDEILVGETRLLFEEIE